MRLSEILQAQEWLSQFAESDRSYACLLLDSLNLISQENLIRDIKDLILQESNKVEHPIALVPVREMEKRQSYYGPSQNKDARPKLLFEYSYPGSEGVIAHVSETIRRLGGTKRKFIENPSLSNMKKFKCRTVFFLDDSVGSGERMKRFLDSFEMHKTIKSWYSYQLIKYYVITYTITIAGEKKIRERNHVPEFRYVKQCPTFEQASWTQEQQRIIVDICRRYAPRGDMALGYGDTMGLLVFEHSVPNNIPEILWQKNSVWKPLFPNRAVPQSLLPAFNTLSIKDGIEYRLSELGQKRLAKGNWFSLADTYLTKVILVLSAVAKKAYQLELVSNYTNLSTLEVGCILSKCKEWGLIDERHRLTKVGLSELQHARSLKKTVQRPFANSKDFYYPQSLRRT